MLREYFLFWTRVASEKCTDSKLSWFQTIQKNIPSGTERCSAELQSHHARLENKQKFNWNIKNYKLQRSSLRPVRRLSFKLEAYATPTQCVSSVVWSLQLGFCLCSMFVQKSTRTLAFDCCVRTTVCCAEDNNRKRKQLNCRMFSSLRLSSHLMAAEAAAMATVVAYFSLATPN